MERQSGQNRYYRSMGDVSGRMGDVSGRWAMSVVDVSGRWAMSVVGWAMSVVGWAMSVVDLITTGVDLITTGVLNALMLSILRLQVSRQYYSETIARIVTIDKSSHVECASEYTAVGIPYFKLWCNQW